MRTDISKCGRLALAAGALLALQPLRSAHGWYLGTSDEDGPNTRESVEYFPNQQVAQQALTTGNWTQRDSL